MSGREWREGDVGVTAMGHVMLIDADEDTWVFDDGSSHPGNRPNDLRPLVVLDPEDRKQIERLADVFCAIPSSGWVAQMQDALRSLITPRPDEPTALGTVHVDKEGFEYVRVDSTGSKPWRLVDVGAYYSWADICDEVQP